MNLQVHGRQFRIAIVRRETTRSITLTVYPDLRITAVVPRDVSLEIVESRIRRRGLWIEKQVRFFESYLPREPERRYVSGESFRYMGRQYRLKVEKGHTSDTKLKGRFLHVRVPDTKDHQLVRVAVQAWYLERCRIVYPEKLNKCFKRSSDVLKISIPQLVIRKMEKRWGSYSPRGRMLLNTDLIKVPGECIEYVIMHELCHSRHPDHSRKFEHLLSRLMPEWRAIRKRLDREL